MEDEALTMSIKGNTAMRGAGSGKQSRDICYACSAVLARSRRSSTATPATGYTTKQTERDAQDDEDWDYITETDLLSCNAS
jgi:hypothetical protein